MAKERRDEDEDQEEEGPRQPPPKPRPPDEQIQSGAAGKRPAPRDEADAEPRRRRPRDDDDPDRRRRRPDRYDDDRPRRRSGGDDAVSTLIPYKNGLALSAYYCGVFALIPCIGVILGVIAFILGCMGLSYVKKHPEAKGTGHAIAGIVLGALVVLGHVGAVLWMIVMDSRRW